MDRDGIRDPTPLRTLCKKRQCLEYLGTFSECICLCNGCTIPFTTPVVSLSLSSETVNCVIVPGSYNRGRPQLGSHLRIFSHLKPSFTSNP